MRKEGMGQTIIVSGERYFYQLTFLFQPHLTVMQWGWQDGVGQLNSHPYRLPGLIISITGQVHYALPCVRQPTRRQREI